MVMYAALMDWSNVIYSVIPNIVCSAIEVLITMYDIRRRLTDFMYNKNFDLQFFCW